MVGEVGSTLTAAAAIDAGKGIPTWIVARRETAARGRRGRPWIVPEGNFSGTLVLWPDSPPGHAALRGFVAALAVLDACLALTCRGSGFALKWPNDVLLNGGKLAGILLESGGTGESVRRLAIGIGVNLVTAPSAGEVDAQALHPVSLMSETGIRVGQEEFLDCLAVAYAVWEERFCRKGFAPIRTAWLERATRLGETIIARVGDRRLEGVFETVDEAGRLVLQSPDGRRAIPAADVYFLETAHASGS